MSFSEEHPLSVPCTSTGESGLHEWCQSNTCTGCTALWLIATILAVARALALAMDEGLGVYAIAATMLEVPTDAAPGEAWSWAAPRINQMLHSLRQTYARFDPWFTLEQDANGRANLHLVAVSGSHVRKRTVRRAFIDAGLGGDVCLTGAAVPRVEHPLSLVCYMEKLAAMGLLLGSAAPIAFGYALALRGGRSSGVTPLIVKSMGGALSIPTEWEVAKVGRWLQEHWLELGAKTPPFLKAQLDALGALDALPGQTEPGEYVGSGHHSAVLDEFALPEPGTPGVLP
jgi:hypothetical protein